MNKPLILTVTPDQQSQKFFTDLRNAHFPKERNFLQAHLTLFHHLPHTTFITDTLKEVTQSQSKIELKVTGLMYLGNGVAFKLESKILTDLHKQLQDIWQEYLIPQDRQSLRPHVTVQNKVSPEAAKDLYKVLSAAFVSFSVVVEGLDLYLYEGGPWKHLRKFPFGNN